MRLQMIYITESMGSNKSIEFRDIDDIRKVQMEMHSGSLKFSDPRILAIVPEKLAFEIALVFQKELKITISWSASSEHDFQK